MNQCSFDVARMVPNKEIEFESGEYDDVTRDEIEDYSPGSESHTKHIYLFIYFLICLVLVTF